MASQPISTIGTPVSDVFIEFLTNPKAAMYMPTAKTGKGSSNTPSDAEVLRASSLLEHAMRDRGATDKPVLEEVQEPASSPDTENLFGDVDAGVLMKTITSLEEHKIFKDVQIASLLEEITHKNQQIQDIETNMGSLSAIVMDLKQKLEGKFRKEFAKLRKEYTIDEKEQIDKEREESLNKYIQDPPRTMNLRMKQKEVIIRNVGSKKNYGFQDLPDRYVVTTGKDRYGNRIGIRSWSYNDEKGLFLVIRRNGKVEYYSSASPFKSWIAVDLRELSDARYHDQCRNPNCKIGWNLYNKL
ncbi:hypothetical protein Hanom_Chr12g01143111 [Helianthus anomalus]